MDFKRWTFDNENGGVAHNFRLRFWRMQLHLVLLHHRYLNPSVPDRFVVQFHTTYDCKRKGSIHER